jgi:hypothetical protein
VHVLPLRHSSNTANACCHSNSYLLFFLLCSQVSESDCRELSIVMQINYCLIMDHNSGVAGIRRGAKLLKVASLREKL